MFYLCSSKPNYYETGLILKRLGEVSKICLGYTIRKPPLRVLETKVSKTFLDLRRHSSGEDPSQKVNHCNVVR